MIAGVVRETYPNEQRIALVPAVIPQLIKAGIEVRIQAGAGEPAGFSDSEFRAKGASIFADREEILRSTDILCQVRTAGANANDGASDLRHLPSNAIVIGLADPLFDAAPLQAVASSGATVFAMELLPRITRAQAMDVLSSQATIAGYKAVLLAAERLPRMFPMMMTAAGTISPARVFVIGAGVAGLQAIASAKRLGALVQGYDIRPAVKEQVESLGARFVQMDLQTAGAEDKGGYAKAMDERFYQRQRDLMATVVAQSDVVISTAAVPGARPPVLITSQMVESMPAGSVVIDLAARAGMQGGNCELTMPDEVVNVARNGAVVLGPTNLPATVPQTASQLYAKNMVTFVTHLVKDGKVVIDMGDEITRETLLIQKGEIVNARVREKLKLPSLQAAAAPA